MCWKLPSTLRLSRLAPASTNVAARFTTIPTSATITTIAPCTPDGETSRWIASKTIHRPSSTSVIPFACALRISTRPKP